MTKQELWKLTKTKSRKNAVRLLTDLLNEPVFSKLMDRVLMLAEDRLKQRDEIRRDIFEQVVIIKRKLDTFNLIPEDVGLVWRAK